MQNAIIRVDSTSTFVLKRRNTTGQNLYGWSNKPRPWRGRCQAGCSNTGGPHLPRKRAPLQKMGQNESLLCISWMRGVRKIKQKLRMLDFRLPVSHRFCQCWTWASVRRRWFSPVPWWASPVWFPLRWRSGWWWSPRPGPRSSGTPRETSWNCSREPGSWKVSLQGRKQTFLYLSTYELHRH